jgi:steroid 5-alpha reductase family enzyme
MALSLELMLPVIFGLWVYMTCLYCVALYLKNNGVADIGYGIGFTVVAYLSAAQTTLSLHKSIILVLVTLWAVRLALRIFRKNYGKSEDFRYKAWRDSWGATFWWRSYLQVYMLQGLIILIVSSPLVVAILEGNTEVLNSLFVGGVLLWIIGFVCESLADYQLDSFIKNPENKGKIMTVGLWKYSRHPNYFGESLMWVSLWLVAISLSHVALFTVISPLLITYLLLYVSGVPLLEKRWEGRADWEEYKKKTSVFVPMPQRK